MKLFTAHRAPNPRRVLMFLAEKGIGGITLENVDLNQGQHKSPDFLSKSPHQRTQPIWQRKTDLLLLAVLWKRG